MTLLTSVNSLSVCFQMASPTTLVLTVRTAVISLSSVNSLYVCFQMAFLTTLVLNEDNGDSAPLCEQSLCVFSDDI